MSFATHKKSAFLLAASLFVFTTTISKPTIDQETNKKRKWSAFNIVGRAFTVGSAVTGLISCGAFVKTLLTYFDIKMKPYTGPALDGRELGLSIDFVIAVLFGGVSCVNGGLATFCFWRGYKNRAETSLKKEIVKEKDSESKRLSELVK